FVDALRAVFARLVDPDDPVDQRGLVEVARQPVLGRDPWSDLWGDPIHARLHQGRFAAAQARPPARISPAITLYPAIERPKRRNAASSQPVRPVWVRAVARSSNVKLRMPPTHSVGPSHHVSSTPT